MNDEVKELISLITYVRSPYNAPEFSLFPPFANANPPELASIPTPAMPQMYNFATLAVGYGYSTARVRETL